MEWRSARSKRTAYVLIGVEVVGLSTVGALLGLMAKGVIHGSPALVVVLILIALVCIGIGIPGLRLWGMTKGAPPSWIRRKSD